MKRIDNKLECKSCGTIYLDVPEDLTRDTPIGALETAMNVSASGEQPARWERPARIIAARRCWADFPGSRSERFSMQEDDQFLRVASMGMTRAAIRARPEFKLAEGNPELGRLLDILEDQSAGPPPATNEGSELALAIVREIMSGASET